MNPKNGLYCLKFFRKTANFYIYIYIFHVWVEAGSFVFWELFTTSGGLLPPVLLCLRPRQSMKTANAFKRLSQTGMSVVLLTQVYRFFKLSAGTSLMLIAYIHPGTARLSYLGESNAQLPFESFRPSGIMAWLSTT